MLYPYNIKLFDGFVFYDITDKNNREVNDLGLET